MYTLTIRYLSTTTNKDTSANVIEAYINDLPPNDVSSSVLTKFVLKDMEMKMEVEGAKHKQALLEVDQRYIYCHCIE